MIKAPQDNVNYVAIGKVVKPQGLAGQLKVMVYSGNPELFTTFKHIFLGNVKMMHPYTLQRSRAQGKFAVLTLSDVTDRTRAEAHVGQEVWVMNDQMPPLAPDEFYWHELVGLTVITEQGQELGKVTTLIATGAHDVMVVTSSNNEEYLIPVVEEIIVRQDANSGILVISPPPGLLEINRSDAF